MKKNVTLILSGGGAAFFYFLFVSETIHICDIYCSNFTNYYHRSFLFFPFLFLFSLITYFAPERVFAAWWKFARLAIPLIFIPILLINLELHHGPQVQMPQLFDIPALIILYSIFTIGSVWQIWKGWRAG